MNLQNFFFRTGVIRMSGMGKETLEFDIHIGSNNIHDPFDFFIVTGVYPIPMVSGIYSQIYAYRIFQAFGQLPGSFGMDQ